MKIFTAFRITLVQGKATDLHVLARMIREIEMPGDCFGCVLVVSFNVLLVFAETVT